MCCQRVDSNKYAHRWLKICILYIICRTTVLRQFNNYPQFSCFQSNFLTNGTVTRTYDIFFVMFKKIIPKLSSNTHYFLCGQAFFLYSSLRCITHKKMGPAYFWWAHWQVFSVTRAVAHHSHICETTMWPDTPQFAFKRLFSKFLRYVKKQ